MSLAMKGGSVIKPILSCLIGCTPHKTSRSAEKEERLQLQLRTLATVAVEVFPSFVEDTVEEYRLDLLLKEAEEEAGTRPGEYEPAEAKEDLSLDMLLEELAAELKKDDTKGRAQR